MVGVTLVTLAGFSWLFAMPRTSVDTFRILTSASSSLSRSHRILHRAGLSPGRHLPCEAQGEAGIRTPARRQNAWRRAGLFFGIMTLANIIIGSQLTYRSVEHMETVQFCGQTCHVMKPEFTAHLLAPHQQVECAACHVAPGASGWFKAKMAGTNQLIAVVFNTFPRPIESALEDNRLVSSAATCEQCHARNLFIGSPLKVITKYNEDETNSRTETVLMMQVGGGRFGGIHGAHMGPGVQIRYAPRTRNAKRSVGGISQHRHQRDANLSRRRGESRRRHRFSVFEMQCADCHNRAAHSFEAADRAVDDAITTGRIASDLPL